MIKSDLVTALSEKEDLSEKKALNIINLIFDDFTKALKNEGRIEIRDFGVFTLKKYKAYLGRNPKTGGKITVEAKKNAFFKVGKELKRRVDRKMSASEPHGT
jgi:integration host factor subunit beta